MRHFLRLAALLALLFAAWLYGLVVFVARLPDHVEDPERHTDAIVVPTGGSERLAEGVRLLIRGLAGKLFVSGVNAQTRVADLIKGLPPDIEKPSLALADCCIVLGHAADSTLGNAAETAAWMRAEGFHSLRLVTADYHMPRSLLEFHHAMPDVEITIHPVFPDQLRRNVWWRSPGTAGLLIYEYNKYLGACLRLAIADLLGLKGGAASGQ
jgi:uncharacterized SAM-binding protein YcdF (DUF218 family)